MAVTGINSEDRLVQATFAEHLETVLGWENVYAFNAETFGPDGMLGRADTKEAVLSRDLRKALERLNADLPATAIDDALRALTVYDVSRSTVQHNRDFYRMLRGGVPVHYRDVDGRQKSARARVIDFDNAPGANRFLAVRELKLTGIRTPNYNRRADLVCFVNGLPLVFIELKAVYKNIRAGFDGNLRDYMDENVIAHAFHHNAFLIVSNGDRARYGSITSEWDHFAEWKRSDEADKGDVDAEVLLNGMLAHGRLLDLVENFILFDESKAGAMRKVMARNHQVLGVNRAVASVAYQEELKREFPPEQRLRHRVVELPLERSAPKKRKKRDQAPAMAEAALPSFIPEGPVNIIERAHPDLGRLGVFWHTQGSGKSYSMAFFAEKVRRKVPGNFTFLLMTDRNDLDSQIYKTFVGCGVAGNQTPRTESGDDLEELLKENHQYVFSLIHKFNKDVDPKKPYSERDDIIVISDEAHRTQAGRLARNMRLALPNAAFIGFTGTPLFKQDEITKRIFGDYVSRYNFKRSEEDGATVKLVYENRGEKLGLARLDLNDRIATKIEEAELDPDQAALLDRLLGQDYEVITADERLDKIAQDFVEHCTTRWEAGKSMIICIDKITCARMHQLIIPRWQAKAVQVRAALDAKRSEAALTADGTIRAALLEEAQELEAKANWLDETIIEIIISEAQNEVGDFKKWSFDIIPHRALMKQGFETGDGQRVDVESAFKNPQHRFRVAIVCAMWLTGFDVEDSAEVVEFMTLFARLKDWCDDTPEELFDFAKTDTSVKDLCTQLSLAADFLKMNERRARALFAAPVDPTFLAAWRDYEERYQSVVSDVWLADFWAQLGLDDSPETGERPHKPKADLQWETAEDEAGEQAGGIAEAIEFAQWNAEQDWRWDGSQEEFIESIKEGVAAWGRLEQDTDFNLRGIFRRRALVPFVLIPRQVAAKHGSAETFSMLKNLQQAHDAFVYCRENKRVCPLPQFWNELWGMLPNRTRAGNGWNPSLPLILAAWHDTPAMLKMLRLAEHIEWAAKHGALESVAGFLRELREEDWYHVGE